MTTKEAEADRTTIANFIKGQPEEWIAPSGSLTGFECLERMSFAEKYADPQISGLAAEEGLNLEDFVESHADIDRVEFAGLLGGKWVDEIEAGT